MHLENILEQINAQHLPPVEHWRPELSGKMDLQIKYDGTWMHEGSPIERLSLVKLFSGILRKEDDEYFLLTPVEKWQIQVECTPFVITQAERYNENNCPVIVVTDNVGYQTVLNDDHKLLMTPAAECYKGECENATVTGYADDSVIPMVHIRNGLNARLETTVYYQMAEWIETKTCRNEPHWVLRSAGASFDLGRAEVA